MAKKETKDALLGSLDLLILRVVSTEDIHGYGIARRIEQISQNALSVQQGSLYPALHRLEKKAFIRSSWEMGEGKKPVKMYSLTRDGQRQLEVEQTRWEQLSAAINLVLRDA